MVLSHAKRTESTQGPIHIFHPASMATSVWTFLYESYTNVGKFKQRSPLSNTIKKVPQIKIIMWKHNNNYLLKQIVCAPSNITVLTHANQITCAKAYRVCASLNAVYFSQRYSVLNIAWFSRNFRTLHLPYRLFLRLQTIMPE